jgi:hypothetical protein
MVFSYGMLALGRVDRAKDRVKGVKEVGKGTPSFKSGQGKGAKGAPLTKRVLTDVAEPLADDETTSISAIVRSPLR